MRYSSDANWNASNPNDIGDLKEGNVYPGILSEQITAAAWNNIFKSPDGVSGNKFLTKYWNGTAAADLPADTVKITWQANDIWSNGRDTDYMRAYLDDGSSNTKNGPKVTVTGIPYARYDVIIYCNSDSAGNTPFHAYTVNGLPYTAVNGATVKGGASWGQKKNTPVAEGTNALRINGLYGTLNIKGLGRDDNARSCIAAIQIVENTAAPAVPTENFKYYSGSGNVIERATANWWNGSTSWHWDHDPRNERIAYYRNAYSVLRGTNNYTPGSDVQWGNMESFTMAYIVDVTDMAADDKWKVIACMGGIENANTSLVLFKNPDGGVSLRPRVQGVDDDSHVLTIPASEITQGYHLFAVTSDTANNQTTLRMDNGTARSMNYAVKPTVGFQVGKNWNGNLPATWGYGNGLGVYAVLGWEQVLTATQIDSLYSEYSFALGTPINYCYDSNFNNGNDDGVLYVPTMTSDQYAFRATRGTIDIPTNSTVTVPSVCLGNNNTAYNYTFNLHGTMNVTSASTTYNVYSEKCSDAGIGGKGVLFGHWNGTGVENIYGTLNAPDCWIQACLTFTSTTLNINGGKVTALGIYRASRNNNASSASISNGGVLEVGELKLDAAWPLTCGAGTIRARDDISGAAGLTHGYAVSFNDAMVGTTLDPNGLPIEFLGAASGAGKVVVNDQSEDEEGTVTFSGDLSGFTGTFSVLSGALYLPETYTPNLDRATTKEDTPDKEGYRKYVHTTGLTVASVEIGGVSTDYETINEAITALGDNAGKITLYVACAGTDFTLKAGQSLNTLGYATGTVSSGADDSFLVLLNGVYTVYPNGTNESETWTGLGGDIRWKNPANWSLGFVPLKTTPVIIPQAGATISIAEHNETEMCASMVLDGDLTLTYDANGTSGWPVLYFYEGGVSGTGTLKLERACLRNTLASELEISAPLVIGTDARGDSSLLGVAGWNVSGGLTVQNGGYLVVRDHALNVTGATTIEQGAKLGPAGVAMVFNGTTTFNGSFERGADGNSGMTFGNVEVAASTTLPGDSNITLDGNVAIDAGATLNIPSTATISENAKFVLKPGAVIADGTGNIDADEVSCSEEGYFVEKRNGVWMAFDTAAWVGGTADAQTGRYLWTEPENWSTHKVPTSSTIVTIPSGAVISLTTRDGTETCAGIEVAGDAEIRYDGNGWVEFYMYGGISGEHALTIHHICMRNESGIRQEIASPLIIDTKLDDSIEGVDGDCAMIGGWDISGDLTVKGVIKAQAQALNVTGDATIEEGATLWPNQRIEFSGLTTFNGTFLRKENTGLVFGDVKVAGTTTIPDDTAVTFNGKVTIAAKQTLTIPASATVGDDAEFVLAGFNARLVDVGGKAAGKVTKSVSGSRIVITTDGTTTTYRLRPVGFTVSLR